MGPLPVPEPTPWLRDVFSLGCYVAALLVVGQALHVRRTLHVGRLTRAFFGGPPVFAPRDDDGTFAVSELLLFGFFVVNFYALETWATYASPYFVYAQSFPLMLPTPPLASLPAWFRWLIDPPAAGVVHCNHMVGAYLEAHRLRTIPLEIPLMEATLAYVALHATRLVRATYWSRPFLAGFAVLALDALLDPVVSDVFRCDLATLYTPGLGLWRWYTVPPEMGQWFGVPLFNFGAWYAGAVISIALPGLLSAALRRWRAWRRRRDPLAIDPGRPYEVLVWFGILSAALLVRALNPIARDGDSHWYAQLGAASFVAMLLLAAFIAGIGLAHRRSDNWPRIALVAPPLFFLAYPLAIRLSGSTFDGAAWVFPWWFAVGLFALGAFLVVYPYWRSLWPWSRRSSA